MEATDSPFATSPEASPSPSRLMRHWPFLAAVLGLHVLACLYIGLIIDVEGNKVVVGLVFGVLFAQITLLAVWTAWAPVSLFVRLMTGLLVAGGVAFSLALCILRNTQGAGGAIVFAAILLAQWLVAQIPLWLTRILRGQRIAPFQECLRETTVGELQFGIRQLLILTTCVALLLGAARMLSPDLNELRNDGDALILLALFASFNLLVPLPAIWAAFARSAFPWLAASAGYAACVTLAESYAFRIALGSVPDDNIFVWINVPFFLVTVGTLLAFRYLGFRATQAQLAGRSPGAA